MARADDIQAVEVVSNVARILILNKKTPQRRDGDRCRVLDQRDNSGDMTSRVSVYRFDSNPSRFIFRLSCLPMDVLQRFDCQSLDICISFENYGKNVVYKDVIAEFE